MTRSRLDAIVRQFRENGLKLLLENPPNVRDLLALTGTPLLDRIVFERMTVDPTTYVSSDYRHVASDLVLHAPLRLGKGTRRLITLYILIEHQSEADPLMLLRVLDYVVQIWKAQVRRWGQQHPSLAGVRLQPILPVVLYTGTWRWDTLGRLVDLIDGGHLVEAVTPILQPLYLNLPAIPAAQLETRGGFFGWVLQLLQQRQARPEEFQGLLSRVVDHLENMPAAERVRWLDLLSYIHALVYHVRDLPDHRELQEIITASVRTDEHRREVTTMGQTIAEGLFEEGRKAEAIRSRQEMLLRQLRIKFKKVPRASERAITATRNVQQLDTWLDRIVVADTLADVGIGGNGP